MKKTKIVLLGLNGRGGTLQYASHVSSGLSDYVDISLLIPTYSDTKLISKKVKLLRIPAPTSIVKTFFLTIYLPEHIRIIKQINSKNPDIINILDIHPWYIMYWPFLKGKKYVTINDPEPHDGEGNFIMMFLIKSITKFLLKNAEKIIVLGEKQKETIRKLGYKQEIIVSRIGSYDFFNKTNSTKFKEEKNTILFFGRIKDYKGLKYLLQSLILLNKSKQKFRLIIAGEGDISSYTKLIAQLKDKIEIETGYISDDKVSEYFQRASFVVMPYTDATQTGVVQVAYSFNKPVIATNVGSLPEVVLDGKTGLIVEPRNVEELSQAIKKLLNNNLYTKKLGINAHNFVKTDLNWKTITKKLSKELSKF